MDGFKKVTIIGVGLIGGSLGLALKKNPDLSIIGVGRNKEHLNQAIARGAIDKGTTQLEEAVRGADLVFIATPVSGITKIAKRISPHLKKGAVITDVGSAKAHIVKSIERFVPKDVHFIGGHPMAGSEQQGVLAASANLFKNSFYILTPTKKTDAKAFKRLHSLLSKTGAQVIAIPPEKHDQVVAVISHLPHLMASSLVNLAAEQTKKEENLLLLAAGSFRDTTRTAASSPQIWLDICLENKGAILKAISGFQRKLSQFAHAIRENNKKAITKKLEEAKLVREEFPIVLKKKPTKPKRLTIPVLDKPGMLSEITVIIGNLGINIEDLEIVPVAKTSGLIKVTVSGQKSAKLAAEALKKKGYEVKINDT